MRMVIFLLLAGMAVPSLSRSSRPARDTVPPSGKLIDPAPFSVITGNVIQFSAQANDSGSGVKEVRYYAAYFSFIDSNASPLGRQGHLEYHLIGRADEPPFICFWDCSKIPDQDDWRMSFYCDIEDSAGNVCSKAGGIRYNVVLDRHPGYSAQRWTSQYSERPILIDGDLREWPAGDTLTFTNGNNRIWALSAWDRERLYFAIRVEDAQLTSPPNDTIPFWWYDCIEIYLDMLQDRSSHRKLDDRQLDIGVADTFNGNIVEFEKGVNRRWRDGVKCKVRHFGTINETRDTDSGYIIEVSFDWKELDFIPKGGKSFGFDIFNDDNDFGGRVRMAKGWSGTERYNNNNPSEWGTLVLQDQSSQNRIIAAAGIFITLFAGSLALFLAKRRKLSRSREPASNGLKPEKQAGAKQYQADRIIHFIEQNFHDPDLSLISASETLKMSESYLRQVLKAETGQTFSDYLSHHRIEQSKKLLKERPDLNITEISISCGFSSLEYFVQVFRKQNNQTPSLFRQNPQNWRNP
jgi:AraC-like DNA-binding protein